MICSSERIVGHLFACNSAKISTEFLRFGGRYAKIKLQKNFSFWRQRIARKFAHAKMITNKVSSTHQGQVLALA